MSGGQPRRSRRKVDDERQRLLRGAPWMRPGLYIPVDGELKVWHHWLAKVPSHLRSTHVGQRSAVSKLPLWQRLRRVVRIPDRAAQPPECSATVATIAKNGALVLLDPAAGRVVRVEREARYWEGYRHARERIATYLPSVPFTLHLDGRVMSEPFVPGTSLGALTHRQQLDGIRRILHAFAELVANEQQGTSAAYMGDVLAKAQAISLRGSLSRFMPWTWLGARGQCWPLVISHGDTLPRNFIFGESGPVLIDFDPALLRPRPFWFDSIKVFLAWESEELVKSLLSGQFNFELDELWKAAGELPADRVDPLALLAAASLLVGYGVSGDGTNVRKFQRRTKKAWAVVRSARKALAVADPKRDDQS